MLGSKFKDCYYWYNDQYMYFSFNGHHSSKYNLFIQNSKELTIENTVGAASEYSNAMLQEGTYYLGTSRKQKTFKRKCAAEGLTLNDYKRMMKWLTVGTTGELVFDSDRFWGWTVVLDTVGDATFKGDNNFLIVEFELTFKTVGTYLAHSVYPGAWLSTNDTAYEDIIGTNQYGIPTAIVQYTKEDKADHYNHYIECYIQNISNEFQNFILSITGTEVNPSIIGDCSLQIVDSLNNKQYFDAHFSGSSSVASINEFEYVSNLSSLYVDGQIAEENSDCVYTKQLNGIPRLISKEPIELYANHISTEGNSIRITLNEESLYELASGQYNYICVSIQTGPATQYSIAEYGIDEYKTNIISFIGFINNNNIQQSPNIGICEFKEDKDGNYPNPLSVYFSSLPNNLEINANSCKIYCGYINHFTTTLQTKPGNQITFNVMVNSYNNL